MNRNGLTIALVLFASIAGVGSTAASAAGAAVDRGAWEVGVLIGEPTGFSAKYWTATNTALDFGAAWSFQGDGQFHFHCDYLFHNYDLIKVDRGSLPVYFGIGGRVRFDENDNRLGLRIAIGAEYLFDEYPMSIFFEVAPIVDFAPETEADLNGGIGIRYVF
ncbi:MAG: hypothetical protein PHD74_06100 [Candidatus Krumholzibacteria bacterium]|nr:hypothetical protein [Candidatus Krumholzibacteria bacterium]